MKTAAMHDAMDEGVAVRGTRSVTVCMPFSCCSATDEILWPNHAIIIMVGSLGDFPPAISTDRCMVARRSKRCDALPPPPVACTAGVGWVFVERSVGRPKIIGISCALRGPPLNASMSMRASILRSPRLLLTLQESACMWQDHRVVMQLFSCCCWPHVTTIHTSACSV